LNLQYFKFWDSLTSPCYTTCRICSTFSVESVDVFLLCCCRRCGYPKDGNGIDLFVEFVAGHSKGTGSRCLESAPGLPRSSTCAIHMCVPEEPVFQILRAFFFLATRKNDRVRTRIHQGSFPVVALAGNGLCVPLLTSSLMRIRLIAHGTIRSLSSSLRYATTTPRHDNGNTVPTNDVWHQCVRTSRDERWDDQDEKCEAMDRHPPRD
jgi:hypothetical protein